MLEAGRPPSTPDLPLGCARVCTHDCCQRDTRELLVQGVQPAPSRACACKAHPRTRARGGLCWRRGVRLFARPAARMCFRVCTHDCCQRATRQAALSRTCATRPIPRLCMQGSSGDACLGRVMLEAGRPPSTPDLPLGCARVCTHDCCQRDTRGLLVQGVQPAPSRACACKAHPRTRARGGLCWRRAVRLFARPAAGMCFRVCTHDCCQRATMQAALSRTCATRPIPRLCMQGSSGDACLGRVMLEAGRPPSTPDLPLGCARVCTHDCCQRDTRELLVQGVQPAPSRACACKAHPRTRARGGLCWRRAVRLFARPAARMCFRVCTHDCCQRATMQAVLSRTCATRPIPRLCMQGSSGDAC